MANKNYNHGGDGNIPPNMMGMLGGNGGIIPILVGGNQPNYNPPVQDAHAATPPVRTILAMQYLKYLTDKQEKQPVPTSISREGDREFTILNGQEPTPAEDAAGVSAANCLDHYFKGDLPPNIWEKADLVTIPLSEMNCLCTLGRSGAPATPHPNCPICAGKGTMELVMRGNIPQANIVVSNEPVKTSEQVEESPTPSTPKRNRRSEQ